MNDNKKRELSKLYKSKLFMSVFILGLLVAVVSSAWLLSYDKSISGTILDSGALMEINLDLSDFEINQSESLVNIQPLRLSNFNGYTILTYTQSVNSSSHQEFCPDSENDCSVVLSDGTNEIVNGSGYSFYETHDFNLTTTCKPNSCGKILDITLGFS